MTYFPAQNTDPGIAAPLWLTASSPVVAHRALMWDGLGGVQHADPSQASYVFAGIATQSAPVNGAVQVAVAGVVTDPSWSWTPGRPLYAGANGVLTHTPTAAGVLQQVGIAASAQAVLVQPFFPIQRN